MERLKNRVVLILGTLCLLSFLPNNHLLGITRSEKVVIRASHPIFTDSIELVLYDFNSTDFDLIKQVVIDSCVQKFDCDQLEYAWVSVKKEQSDTYLYEVRSMHYYAYIPLYPESVQKVVGFYIDETTFLMDKRSFDIIDESKDATFIDTLLIDQEAIKYDCLEEEVAGDVYPVIFSFNFEARNATEVKLIDYDFLVESGDAGYFYKPSFGERVKMFFKKIF